MKCAWCCAEFSKVARNQKFCIPRGDCFNESRKKALRATNLRKYGITKEDYINAVKIQGGKCAICGTGFPGGKFKETWNVDHDHTSGKFRALLCAACNLGLGCFNDDTQRMMLAIKYLKDYK